MLRTILPLTIAFIAHIATAQETNEKLKGLLWEVSGNGIAKKGYLYGTMHVPEKLAFNLSDSFFIALRQVDMVALETDHDRWQEFTEMLDGRERELFNPGYGNYGYRRSNSQPNLYHTQFLFKAPDNELLGAMLSAKPRMTNEFLYRSNQYRQDYEEDTYLDLFIFQAGRKLGKTVIGLETLEGSYEALVRAQFPDEEEDEESRRYYPGQYSRQTLEDAYRDQDLSLLDSLNKMSQPGKNFQRWMLDERNTVMVNGIDSILQSGTALFSAVGAAHLPSESGLILQLRKKGYTVRPVQFTSEHFKREKEAIEDMRYPVKLTRQWAADSTWSVEAPGKFYQTVDGMGLEQQLCTDMSNGAYYAVYRVHSYGMWNGQSPKYIAERIDSLIYEKIPGKIQERKRLTEPFPGHEITTRTRRGDIIRYKVFATPMEIIVFATGGNGDYAAGPEGAQFINSVQFHRQQVAKNSQNTTIRPPHGGFQVQLPAPPIVNTTLDKTADRYLVATSDPADSAFYMAYRAIYHDWNYIEEDSFELNIIGEKIAEQFTKESPEMTLVSEAPFPTQDISFRSETDSARYFLRLVIDGPHYYLLACRKHDPEPPTDFFNSFSIEPTDYPQGWETLRDTSVLFEAKVPKAALKTTAPFIEKLQALIREGYKKSKRNGSYYNEAERAQYRVLELPLQGEAISITSGAMTNGELGTSLDSFQSYIQKIVTDRNQMAIQRKSWDTITDSLVVGNFFITDTNSIRSIRTKVVLTPGRFYTVSATVQVAQPESAFINEVFDSFTPIDTTSGSLPFGKRDLSFLQEIYSTDSLTREKALGELDIFWYKYLDEAAFSKVRTAIEHPQFGQLKYRYRRGLLRCLGKFENPEAPDYILTLLDRYPDSLRYRQTLLVNLAALQTKKAYKTLFNQLKQEKIFVTKRTIGEMADFMDDSLKLTMHYLPDLLDLSELEEYQEEVYNLVSNALVQKLLKPRAYRSLKSRLLRKAYQGLARQQYSVEKKQDQGENNDYLSDDYEPIYEYDYSGNTGENDLERNLQMLAPFMRKDKKVQELFDEAAASPDKETQILAMSLLLQQQLPVRQNTLQAFANDDRTKYTLYRHLAAVDKLDRYASWFADTVALVRSILYEDLGRQTSYNDAKNEIDSVRFVSRHRTVRYNTPALVYFFDIKKKKDKEWILAYVNVPLSTDLFGYKAANQGGARNAYDNYYWLRPEVRLLSHLPESEKEEYIRKKIGEIRFANRQRYRSWGGGDDYYYDN